MKYSEIFRPETLQKLDKESAENLRQMLGDKNLMQTLQSSMGLLNQVIKMEEPYKAQLEELAIQMVEDMYPIIHEDNINIDAKIVGMDEINQSLDEIKINPPSQYNPNLEDNYKPFEKGTNAAKTIQNFLKVNSPASEKQIVDIISYNEFMYAVKTISDTLRRTPNVIRVKSKNPLTKRLIYTYKYQEDNKSVYDRQREVNEIKISTPKKWWIGYYADSYQYSDEEFIGTQDQAIRKAISNFSMPPKQDYKYWAIINDVDSNKEIGRVKLIDGKYQFYQLPGHLNENSPESKRRVINGITQGAALRGAFSFYLFKEYLDVIDPNLIEKYNQLMKEVFGVYDDPNAIAMFLQMLAMGQKMGGGSSKVIVNEIKINKPNSIQNLIKNNGDYDYIDTDVIRDILIKKFPYESKQIEEYIYDIDPDDLESYENSNIIDIINDYKLYKKYSLEDLNEQEQKGITIKARALCFPMLVHEIIKGLYELVSLQGFQGTKDQNQAVVDKVDKLEHEPEDIKYGKLIFDALNDIFANSGYDDNRIREYFFAEVYQLGDTEFIEFIEGAINNELTQSEKRWVQQTLKEISFDLKNDDFDSTGLD